MIDMSVPNDGATVLEWVGAVNRAMKAVSMAVGAQLAHLATSLETETQDALESISKETRRITSDLGDTDTSKELIAALRSAERW